MSHTPSIFDQPCCKCGLPPYPGDRPDVFTIGEPPSWKHGVCPRGPDSRTVRDAIAEGLRDYEPSSEQAAALADTPGRWINALLEMTRGYDVDTRALLRVQFGGVNTRGGIVELRDIAFSSVCEHHLLPFHGVAHVAYVPSGDAVVGISKLARLVDAHARRLQVQERITADVVADIDAVLKPRGARCRIEASHECIGCRGIAKRGAVMVTEVATGCLKRDAF